MDVVVDLFAIKQAGKFSEVSDLERSFETSRRCQGLPKSCFSENLLGSKPKPETVVSLTFDQSQVRQQQLSAGFLFKALLCIPVQAKGDNMGKIFIDMKPHYTITYIINNVHNL